MTTRSRVFATIALAASTLVACTALLGLDEDYKPPGGARVQSGDGDAALEGGEDPIDGSLTDGSVRSDGSIDASVDPGPDDAGPGGEQVAFGMRGLGQIVAEGNYVVWAEEDAGKIWRAGDDGGGAVELPTGADAGRLRLGVRSMVDRSQGDGYVYWSTSVDGIKKTALVDGGTRNVTSESAESLAVPPVPDAGVFFTTGRDVRIAIPDGGSAVKTMEPSDNLVGGDSHFACWTGASKIRCCDLNASCAAIVEHSMLANRIAWAAHDGAPVGRIFAGTSMGLFRLETVGALPPFTSFNRSASFASGNITALAVDDLSGVYYADATEHSVRRVPSNGGATVLVASNIDDCRGIAVTNSYVFFTDRASGTVRRVAKP